jgi:hypothetical protein
MNDVPHRSERRSPAASLVLGGFLLLLGVLLLAGNLGFELPVRVWDWWPFLLIALGVARLFAPGRRERRGGGFWLIVAGLYGWVGTRGLFGLSWETAWPIFIIAVGIQFVVRALWPRAVGEADREHA